MGGVFVLDKRAPAAAPYVVRHCELCGHAIPKHQMSAARYEARRFCTRGCHDAAVRPRRSDALPEHAKYVDTGCSVHPSCLSCPLPACVYEDSHGKRKLETAERRAEAVRLRAAGLSIKEIAESVGCSTRVVFRLLADARGGEA